MASVYRESPPPPRWRLVYRMPFRARVQRGAVWIGFGGLCSASLCALAIGASLGGAVGLALFVFAVMALLSSGTFLTITWMTRLPELIEGKIDAVLADARAPARCHIQSGPDRWT